MDKTAKKNASEQVKRGLTRALAPYGFVRSKPTFWTRVRGPVVEFIHLHLFTSVPAFRVYAGLRVLNDAFPAVALNGLSSGDGWFETDKRYELGFDETEIEVARCSADLHWFYVEVAGPWFQQFQTDQELLGSDSPLTAESRNGLQMALAGKADPDVVLVSEKLLGLNQSSWQ